MDKILNLLKTMCKSVFDWLGQFALFLTILISMAGILEMSLYYLASLLGGGWIGYIFLLCGGVIIVVITLNFLIKIPAYHFGVIERFGNRTGRILYEGLNYLLPFEEVKIVSQELITVEVEADFTTRDGLSLVCKGSLQYRPDPRVVDNEGRNVFVTMSENAIKIGIVDGIKSKLGSLGGIYEGNDFVENRITISQIINVALRLGRDPHEIHAAGDKNKCGVEGCKFKNPVSIKDLVEFYKKHWPLVKKTLDKEDKKPRDRSNVERRHGIDIVKFALADVDFTKETKADLEKQRRTKIVKKAYEEKISMAKLAVIELGASAQVALNSVDVTTDPQIKKSVVSVEGEAGVLGGILEKFKK